MCDCKGIPTDALANGVVQQMVRVLTYVGAYLVNPDSVESKCRDATDGNVTALEMMEELVRGALVKARGQDPWTDLADMVSSFWIE